MQAGPGTYALILRCTSRAAATVGRWGELRLEPGFYIYVGSAFGPGGVKARVLRHCRASASKHWHIDYIREFVRPVGAWYSHQADHLEHDWATMVAGMPGVTAIAGFGCTDCHCRSHLFRTHTAPDFSRFAELAGNQVERWSYDSTILIA
jgi:Uri superfamily endonuclease